jgi:hypothetical protein
MKAQISLLEKNVMQGNLEFIPCRWDYVVSIILMVGKNKKHIIFETHISWLFQGIKLKESPSFQHYNTQYLDSN